MKQNLSVRSAGKVVAVTLAALVVATSLISLPAASAVQTTTIRWKGSSADAYLSSSQADGVHTDIYIFATDSASNQKSARSDQSVAYVNVYQYTQGNQTCQVIDGQQYCWYDYIPVLSFSGYATLNSAQAFQSSRLNSASLQTVMTGFDAVSNSTKTIVIDATLTGVGNTTSGNSVYNYRAGSYIFSSQSVGSYRQANVAISIS